MAACECDPLQRSPPELPCYLFVGGKHEIGQHGKFSWTDRRERERELGERGRKRKKKKNIIEKGGKMHSGLKSRVLCMGFP